MPRLYKSIYKAVKENNITYAVELQTALIKFLDILYKHGARPVFEYIMRKRGYCDYCWRRPHQSMASNITKQTEEELNKNIDNINRLLLHE